MTDLNLFLTSVDGLAYLFTGAMHRHLNNNTPVNTEVLWGYIWSRGWPKWLRAGAPTVDDLQQVEDIDHAVSVHIALAGRCAVITTAVFAEPGATKVVAIINYIDDTARGHAAGSRDRWCRTTSIRTGHIIAGIGATGCGAV